MSTLLSCAFRNARRSMNETAAIAMHETGHPEIVCALNIDIPSRDRFGTVELAG